MATLPTFATVKEITKLRDRNPRIKGSIAALIDDIVAKTPRATFNSMTNELLEKALKIK